MDLQEYNAAKDEEMQQRRDHLRFAAGISDFMGVILGAVVILLMLLLIMSLVNWLRRDILNMLNLLNTQVH